MKTKSYQQCITLGAEFLLVTRTCHNYENCTRPQIWYKPRSSSQYVFFRTLVYWFMCNSLIGPFSKTSISILFHLIRDQSLTMWLELLTSETHICTLERVQMGVRNNAVSLKIFYTFCAIYIGYFLYFSRTITLEPRRALSYGIIIGHWWYISSRNLDN